MRLVILNQCRDRKMGLDLGASTTARGDEFTLEAPIGITA